MKRFILLAFVAVGFLLTFHYESAALAVEQWSRFEQSFTSSKDYDNPARQIKLKVEFTAIQFVINIEPNYEAHNGYTYRKVHNDHSVRRAAYWSLPVSPTAGVTYGGQGIWGWHTKVQAAGSTLGKWPNPCKHSKPQTKMTGFC